MSRRSARRITTTQAGTDTIPQSEGDLTALTLGVRWTLEFSVALGFSAVFGTAIGWWLWTYVLANTSAGIAGLNSLGIPVIAVLGSAIQLGERPPPMELAGMIAIGLALGMLGWMGLRRSRVGAA